MPPCALARLYTIRTYVRNISITQHVHAVYVCNKALATLILAKEE